MNGLAEISVRDLSFCYEGDSEYALQHVNFTVYPGEFCCIIGPNGAGKSTLCNALVGLIPHYFRGRIGGEVIVRGCAVSESSISQICEDVGFVFQNPFNQLTYASETVEQELAYGLANRGMERSAMVDRIDKVSRLMRIHDLLDRKPTELSGGQVQRLALGSAIITHPRILILDECTTQLDPLGAEEIFDIVKDINQAGVAVVMVDHDMERVARCADSVVVLDSGHMVMKDSPRAVFNSSELRSRGIDVPDYVRICAELRARGLKLQENTIFEEETVSMLCHQAGGTR